MINKIPFIYNLFRYLINTRSPKEFLSLIGVMSVSSIMEALGILSIFPLILIISSSEVANQNPIILEIKAFFVGVGLEDENLLIFYLGLLFIFFYLFSVVLKSYSLYIQQKYVLSFEYLITTETFRNILGKNYLWFQKRNNSKLSKTLLSEIGSLTNGFLMPSITFISNLLVIITITIILMFVNLYVTISVAFTFLVLYVSIAKFFKNKVSTYGQMRFESNERRFKYVSETLASIKSIKANNSENFYANHLRKAADEYSHSRLLGQIISLIPKYIVEALIFGGLLTAVTFARYYDLNVEEFLPLIVVFGFASYRLIPAFQNLYSSLTHASFHTVIVEDFISKFSIEKNQQISVKSKSRIPIFENSLNLENVSFSYKTDVNTLSNIDLNIPKGHFIGLVGQSGSGKTTLIDIISGLIPVDSGKVILDDNELDESSFYYWREQIGYVPQDSILFEDTILRNIVFGESIKVDFEWLNYILNTVDLQNFLETLPNGWDTKIGEGGVRLSGGQKQRIGIARALYRKPCFLVLDEATSALDSILEKHILDNLSDFKLPLSGVIISHRVETLMFCNSIIIRKDGEIIEKGDYDFLDRHSTYFRKLNSKKTNA